MARLLHIIQDIKGRLPDLDGEFTDWLARLDDPEYNSIFSEVTIRQRGKLCMFKYKSLGGTVVQKGDDKVMDFTSFWNAHGGIYRELRSVTVDLDRVCYVLRPFDKFFNLNEQPETAIGLVRERIERASSVEFSDKLDGSMQAAAMYEGKIVMSGSSSLDPAQSWRLADGYERLMSQPQYVRMVEENPEYTFIFEYIALADAHVVKYTAEDEGLYLIGVRHTQGGECMAYADVLAMAGRYGVRTTQVFDRTLDQVVSSLGEKKSDEKEGFVLNADGFFVKIKYDDYVQMHRIMSKYSSCNHITTACIDGRLDDLVAKVPASYRTRIYAVAAVVRGYADRFNEEVDRHRDAVAGMDGRGVAEYVRSNGVSGDVAHALFCICKGRDFDPLHPGTRNLKFKDVATKEEYDRVMGFDV